MRLLALISLLPFSVSAAPLLSVDFEGVPTGTVRSLAGKLPGRWIINMKSKVFRVTADLPRPPKNRPDMRHALGYSSEGGWPAGDVYVLWPQAITSGCVEARALVYLPDGRVPVFFGLTRFSPADWKDAGPAAVMLRKRKEASWQCGAFMAPVRPGWNYLRIVSDLERRVAYAFARHEDRAAEEMLAWEAPVETGGKDLAVNALYLRTDHGYSKGEAYFADLQVQACKRPQANFTQLRADLSHVAPPGEAIDLTGIWDFLPEKGESPAAAPGSPPEQTDARSQARVPENTVRLPAPQAEWLKIVVPAEHYPAMRAHGVGRAWFRRTVKMPDTWAGKLVHLRFGMTRARADIYWNRQYVHTHWEGFSAYSLDVTDASRPGEENELLVRIHTHRVLQHPEGPLYPLTWFWMYSTGNGICMPCSVEATPPVRVTDVFARPSVRERKVRLDVTLSNQAHRFGSAEKQTELQLHGRVLSEGKKVLDLPPKDVSVGRGKTIVETLEADWPQPRLWWPHDPHLYTAEASLVPTGEDAGAEPLAARRATFGFREVEIRGPDYLLNGRRLHLRRQSLLPYMKRVLDREWFPNYVEDLRAQGYNCVRIHGGASELLARQADRMGFLIIPEFSIKAHNLDPITKPERFLRGIDHCLGIVREQRNHPSILMWNISNEVYIYGIIRREQDRDRRAHNLDVLGDLVQQLDPTRTVGYDGDCDLNGRAPTASLHYPWHIFETGHPMPTTRFWLDEKRRPWMGYVWQKEKPLIIGEYFHAPYELRAPWGLTQFMGDRAFVHPDGWAEGMHRAYQWMDEGHRYARVACTNPWAVPEPVRRLGTLLRPVFLAVRESNRTFWSGERVERTIHVFNDILHDRDYRFRWSLLSGDDTLASKERTLPIDAGGMQEVGIELRMPKVEERSAVVLRLELLHEEKAACGVETKDYIVYPRPDLKQKAVTVGNPSTFTGLREAGVGAKRARRIASALSRSPDVLVLAGVGADGDEAKQLLDWVEHGGRVVWLDVPIGSWLPAGVQVSGDHRAVHAFRTVAEHPVLAGLDDAALACWRPDDVVCEGTFRKPHLGPAKVLLEAGGQPGLAWAPLIEVRRGSGCFLLCQMGLTRKADAEPAAARMLANLLSYWPSPGRFGPVHVASDPSGTLGDALGKLRIRTSPTLPDAQVLIVGASTPEALTDGATQQVLDRVRRGATLVVRGLVPESAKQLSELMGTPVAVEPATVFHVVRRGRHQLLDGLSNGDLYWSKKELDRDKPVTEGTAPVCRHVLTLAEADGVRVLTDPPALAVIRFGQGQVVLDQVRWAESLQLESVRAARIGTRLLANLGAELETQDAGTKRQFTFVDLRTQTNRGFRDEVKGDGKGGWTDEGVFDMRWFPVNRTGFDEHGNPMAHESFPESVHYGGVDFQLVDPETNAGKSCIILGRADATVPVSSGAIVVERRADVVWFLHAADGYWNNNGLFEVARLRVNFADGQTTSAPLINTKHLHDWRTAASLSEGYLGWVGGNGRHEPCVLYVWRWRNPRPGVPIASIEAEAGEKYRYLLVAVTCETR